MDWFTTPAEHTPNFNQCVEDCPVAATTTIWTDLPHQRRTLQISFDVLGIVQ